MWMKEFVANVLSRIPEIKKEDEEIQNHFKNDIEDLYKKHWTVDDVVAFMRCYEEVNPELDEEVAFEQMSTIRRKYDPQ